MSKVNLSCLYIQILNEEPSDESHEVLSYISSTFSAIEDQIHESRLRRRQWELSSLPRGKPGSGSRPLGGALSFSTGNLDQLLPKGNSLRRNSEFSVSSIPEDVEIHEVLLEKYSNRLLEMVAQKLSKWIFSSAAWNSFLCKRELRVKVACSKDASSVHVMCRPSFCPSSGSRTCKSLVPWKIWKGPSFKGGQVFLSNCVIFEVIFSTMIYGCKKSLWE